MQGKGYDLATCEGERVWMECLARTTSRRQDAAAPAGRMPALPLQIADGGYGEPLLVRPRLGQRSFRVAVLDSYGRRCAVTQEKTLPALEAAHIRDFAEVPEHSINNGILFRADIHKLFDAGYVTVTPDYHFEVSRRIREEFENGRDYYRMNGSLIQLPENASHQPLLEALRWHNEERFRG
jgi:putative restriction endonuclease